MKSIRSFLLSRLLGGAALVLVCAGFLVYVVVIRSLQSQFDRNLTDRVKGFASILFQHEEDEVEFEFSGELMPEYEREELPAYFQLWYEDGRLLERSESLGLEDLELPGEPGLEGIHWSAPMPDGRKGRYVARLIKVHHVFPELGPDSPTAENILVVLALGREGLVAAERMVLLSCIAAILVMMVMIALLTRRSVELGLEPTRRLAATLDSIRMDDLPDHLDVSELPLELVPMAETTDAMIRRVDLALKRERRTSADIAHELRTPISELLTASEVALRNGHDSGDAKHALGTVRDVAWRMARSVSTLLKLARLEMGTETFGTESVAIGSVVRELLVTHAAVGRERELEIVNAIGETELVAADRDVLDIIVSNLLSNALYYTQPRGRIAVRLDRSQPDWRLVVENDALDIQKDDLHHLSAPFWRKDTARADRNRSGLGLALSSALADKAGMHLDFELEDGTFRAILAGRPGPELDAKLGTGDPRMTDAPSARPGDPSGNGSTFRGAEAS